MAAKQARAGSLDDQTVITYEYIRELRDTLDQAVAMLMLLKRDGLGEDAAPSNGFGLAHGNVIAVLRAIQATVETAEDRAMKVAMNLGCADWK